ncbi:hypothetical protein PPL_08586 [Heterostelium album PN500]|uniref:F-box domain-containing protein n=1 Tax=Heterostelium pallidum (strain ATCC 26659 / Pp 5 / PN500) TaxID=670386 RepID=D3BJ61_HETP5|nr:hypothetical protein PPL_08586 [Heterostelium album PN500]EFA77941.1 hypothetical protein PPL_08586 [Heterostelium album PN500]|eukprot:XP_020430069.1 hypothetical protein PPL_08586 [Heterostelium album PN500]
MSNNNNLNIFLNFPHVLLSNIVNNLSDNIDKICFTLVCKRWFNDRDKYLKFNNVRLYSSMKPHIFLNSYRSLLFDAIEQKRKFTLSLGEDSEDKPYDFIITNIDNINTIDKSKNYKITINQDDMSFLATTFNVVKLLKCRTLKFPLPMSLTSIEFTGRFDEPLFQGCFPPTIRSLEFGDRFNQPIEPGVLPTTLEKLSLGFEFNNRLKKGSLPESLRSKSTSTEPQPAETLHAINTGIGNANIYQSFGSW